MSRLASLLMTLLTLVGTAHGHEIRPGYLELKEASPDTFEVVWKMPVRRTLPAKLDPTLPPHCTEVNPVRTYPAAGATIRRWSVACPGGLAGHPVAIDGLENSITDVLVRIERTDGGTQVERLEPSRTSLVVADTPGGWNVAWTYLVLGVEHILLGIDHLLFVLALLIIVRGWRRLVATITAFTLAHSITLAAATLGLVEVSQQPVEAVIALSILFVAAEIVHGRQGRVGLTERLPWLVAFTFGLLHGFGFAGALAEVGLPEQSIPLALLCFNVGVEIGQLLFVAAVLVVVALVRALRASALPRIEITATYAIGTLAAFWTIERVSGFWG